MSMWPGSACAYGHDTGCIDRAGEVNIIPLSVGAGDGPAR